MLAENDRSLRIGEVLEIAGISRSVLYEMVRWDEFPVPFLLAAGRADGDSRTSGTGWIPYLQLPSRTVADANKPPGEATRQVTNLPFGTNGNDLESEEAPHMCNASAGYGQRICLQTGAREKIDVLLLISRLADGSGGPVGGGARGWQSRQTGLQVFSCHPKSPGGRISGVRWDVLDQPGPQTRHAPPRAEWSVWETFQYGFTAAAAVSKAARLCRQLLPEYLWHQYPGLGPVPVKLSEPLCMPLYCLSCLSQAHPVSAV